MTQLRACDACSRHVYATEKVCPFCNAALGEAQRRSFGDRLRRGMSRAQLLAVAAAVGGTALSGCTDTPQNDGVPNAGGGAGTESSGGSGDAGEGGAGGTMSGGAGGAAGTMSGGAGGAGGAGGTMSGGVGGDGGMGQPVYGAPVDAGEEDAAADSGAGGDGMAIPLYGGAPIPDPVP